MKSRVCIIGAGPCGLALLHAFQQDPTHNCEIICYEKQKDWTGLWNFTWRTGTDENGEVVHCSQYHNLWSNGPKECLEFADYTFEEHFGKPIGSFPPRSVLREYIVGRAEKSNVRPLIRFNTSVVGVQFCKHSNKFTVDVLSFNEDKTKKEEFDYVIVATGHFSLPNVPECQGFESFEGRILHSHDFRNAGEFKNQRVLIIGGSYSAEDLALQTLKYGAAEVTITYRTRGMGFKWPTGITERELFTHVDEKKVYWADGSSKEIDAIILCTGYLHKFPFLADDLKTTKWRNLLYLTKLYKGVVWEDNTKLFYLGMHDQYYTFNMFDVQAFFVRDVINGKIKLPSVVEMQKHTHDWLDKQEKLSSEEDKIRFQGDYVKMLMAECECPKFDTNKIDETFIKWEHHKDADIATYRDKSHTSVMTGVKQPPNPTQWMQAFDDSIEAFVNNC